MRALVGVLGPYLEYSRIGFVNILAFRLRYYSGAINFLIGACAMRLKSILALIRAKYWLIELLSGVLIPTSFFPETVRQALSWLPFQHIAFTPLQIYLGKLDWTSALAALLAQWLWVGALLWLGACWWRISVRKITIHGG
jgi:ABC-2 type transport system permease protein